MDRKQLVLAALAAGGENATYSPVQVQKLFFLLDREAAHLTGGPHFEFRPYDYGPFDQAVYWELDRLSSEGSVLTQTAGHYRLYALSPSGYQVGMCNLGELPARAQAFFGSIATWIRQLNFQQLVSAIYRRYPEMKVNSVFQG